MSYSLHLADARQVLNIAYLDAEGKIVDHVALVADEEEGSPELSVAWQNPSDNGDVIGGVGNTSADFAHKLAIMAVKNEGCSLQIDVPSVTPGALGTDLLVFPPHHHPALEIRQGK